MTEDRNCILKRMENVLDNDKKRIILYCLNDEKMLSLLIKEISDKRIDNIIVFQSVTKSLDSLNTTFIDRKELESVLDFYNLYDFSNKISVINESDQYGNMLNYVRSGVLSREEMVEALLY